ncbi:MAG: hypothetical protein QY326_07355 [Bdellovibrionota bacterium]|nr:MAG: hypothetical protein QY326_07355 [Bdellovibrionota bacterium]
MTDSPKLALELVEDLMKKVTDDGVLEGLSPTDFATQVVAAPLPAEALPEVEAPSTASIPDDIRAKIAQMRIAEKIKLALMGNSVGRAILIRDPNRLIQQAVLKNPRITLTELEELSRNTNAADHLLRTIGENKQWMAQYKIRLGIVTNPRTPRDVALKWIRYLQMNDIKNLARSKSVSNVVVTVARKIVADTSG